MANDTQTPQHPGSDSHDEREESEATGEGMPQSPAEIDEDEAQ